MLIANNTATNNAAGVFTANDVEPNPFVRLNQCMITGNQSVGGSSAIFSSQRTGIYNSTIAFNESSGSSAGVYLYGDPGLLLSSTIISNNASYLFDDAFDLVAGTVNGDHNIVLSSSGALPPDTIRQDPQLLPLADNGGYTLTMALAQSSPAIDAGTNILANVSDQRLSPFVRLVGRGVDIGAYESGNPDKVFGDGFDRGG